MTISRLLKKGFLALSILAILKRKDAYGYSLIQDMKLLIEVPESTCYPILKKLIAKKYLNAYSKEFNGRNRKYYQITDRCIQYLNNAITNPIDNNTLYDEEVLKWK